ncbi:hypothetical protein H0H93_014774 [Arthromyces matolae]|nr:hypothetical protein H0H93_014774 [Arthromyces matolae]
MLTESLVEDDLDSVLRTKLDYFDDGYVELVYRRLRWWDSPRIREWLLEKNYKLYENRSCASGFPSDIVYPTEFVQHPPEFPYAYHDLSKRIYKKPKPLFSAHTGPRGIIGYAQDASGRHVAIKAILHDSKEKEILEYLRRECFPKSMDEFRNVLPVLDILACEGHWLAITPRWGDHPNQPFFKNIKQLYHFFRCILKGLSFLHEHRISHGDIRLENILVNHAESWNNDRLNERRQLLCDEGKLVYALFDFSHAHMFPRNISMEECRLPSGLAFAIWPELRPYDTHQGELDFDPFAFDVATLGILFCREFQHVIPVAPMLAPLLDKMTTWDVSQRFTAAEALTFLDEHVGPCTVSQDAMIWDIPRDSYPKMHGTFDRWKDLRPDFVQKWSAYRETPTPLHIRLLRKICEPNWGYWLVRLFRRLGRRIWYTPSVNYRFL